MELEIIRTYFPNGVNGVLRCASRNESGTGQHDKEKPDKRDVICNTIELPWLDNLKQRSCIPEGRYELTKRYSPRLGWHLLVNHVKDRSFILIHAYNNAIKESKGCIAPVSNWTGEGKGENSRASLKKLTAVVYPELEKGNKVFLTIKS